MTKQNFSDFAVRLFYALSICIVVRAFNQIARNSTILDHADWIWPVHWFSYIHWTPEKWLCAYLFTVGSFALAFFFSRSFLVRLNGAYAWLMFLAMVCANGKTDHTMLGWPVVAVFLLWFSPSRQRNERFLIYLMHCYIFSNYFAAGLWKVRAMADSRFWVEPGLMLKKILLDQMAYGIYEGSQELTVAFNFVFQHQYLAAIGWIGVVLLQISAIFGIFYSKKVWFWGALFILFHFGTQLLLGVVFYEHTILLVYLFYILPSVKTFFDQIEKYERTSLL